MGKSSLSPLKALDLQLFRLDQSWESIYFRVLFEFSELISMYSAITCTFPTRIILGLEMS